MIRATMILFLLGMICGVGQSQDKGKLSGVFFADYIYNIGRDSSSASFANSTLTGPKSYQAFQFRRIYFTYDYDVAENFTSRFRLEADQAALTSDGKIGVFVKDAFLRWKGVFGQSDLIFGIQPTPAFDVSEAEWGYRSLEKTIIDLRGVATARDMGISLRGKLDDGGIVGYWIMMANGSANKPETDKYKRYYAHLLLKPVKGLVLTMYADLNARPDITNPFSTAVPKEKVSNSVTTMAAFAGYVPMEGVKLGAEVELQQMSHGFNTGSSLITKNGMGVTVYGIIEISKGLDLVARYDFYDPGTEAASKGDSRGYILGGLAWKVVGGVTIIPNLQVETYEKSPAGRSYDASITGRLTVAMQFP